MNISDVNNPPDSPTRELVQLALSGQVATPDELEGRSDVLQPGAHDEMAVPIIAEGHVLGALYVHAGTERILDQGDIKIMVVKESE